jgi:phosphoglycerol transferase MdoB-like AlkP superfamily enzyme
MELGGKFWLTFIAGAIGFAIAGFAFFLLLEGAWTRWGFLGMCLFFSAILLLFGWIYDKRDKRRREALEAEMARMP